MVYRVCYVTATKKIVEMQSGGDPAPLHTLIDNAVMAGYDPATLTCVYMDESQYAAALAVDPVTAAAVADQRAKDDKVKAAKVGLAATIATQETDKTKVKLTDILDRLALIETALNLR